MTGTGDNHQFLVIAPQFFEGILTEIPRMGLLSMNYQHGILNLISGKVMNGIGVVAFLPWLELSERG